MTVTGTQEHPMLQWAASKAIGRTSEIAVMTPIKLGCVPGERRTFEQRALAWIGGIAAQHQHGMPTVLGAIPAIHFGRLIVIRPEQYLLYSNVPGVDYSHEDNLAPTGRAQGQVPVPMDDYVVEPQPAQTQPHKRGPAPVFRSFVLTLVEFDGDLKVYFRDIALFLAQAFDRIFTNCENYPGTDDFEAFWLWIRRYQINTALFYATYPNLSVVRIKELELFKRRFDSFVARVRSPAGTPIRSMDELFDEFLRDNQQIASGFPTPGGLYEPDGGLGGGAP